MRWSSSWSARSSRSSRRAIVLTITGAEALYADMGHWARTIRLSWFFVFRLLNYLGQGATIINWTPDDRQPVLPPGPQLGAVVAAADPATLATVIASRCRHLKKAPRCSQQATRLGFLPRLHVKHTSEVEGGQIYIGSINWMLYVGVVVLVLASAVRCTSPTPTSGRHRHVNSHHG